MTVLGRPLICSAMLIVSAWMARADEPVVMPEPEKEKPFFSKLLSNLEDSREGMSTFLVDKSNEIDLLFANPNYLATRNTTNLRLSNTMKVADEEGFNNDFDISFKLNLPRSQDKLQFQFDQAVDEFRSGDGSQSFNQNLNQTAEQRQAGRGRAGINFYQNIFDTDLRLTAGVRIKDGLVPWTNVKLRNYLLKTRNDKHLMELIQDYYGETAEGLEHKGYLAYTYKINERFLFRVSNESQYRDFDNSFQISQGMTIFHNVDYGHSLAYGVFALSKNPAAQSVYFVDSYTASVAYRRRLYKRHYYLTIRPGVISPKEKDWELLAGIQVGIDIFFGNP